MELFKATLPWALSMVLLIAFALSTAGENLLQEAPPMETSDERHGMSPSLKRLARAIVIHGAGYGYNHSGNPGRPTTVGCDMHPQICHKNTNNHHLRCCGKRCVDVKNDEFNCGHCGHRCGYRHKCCQGKCKDVMYDKHNCGSCGNKCKKGSCVYGMCNYGR